VLRKLIFMMLCLGIISGFLLLVSTVEAGSYNRAAAVTYADTWAHGRNSAYPSFGSGCNCNDCTNYISQVLHNGGYPLRTGNWNKESIYEWWYRKVLWWYETSNTWSAADWLMMYAAQYTEFEFRSSPTELERGDFFLVDLRDNVITYPLSLRGGNSRRSNLPTGLEIASPPSAARNDAGR